MTAHLTAPQLSTLRTMPISLVVLALSACPEHCMQIDTQQSIVVFVKAAMMYHHLHIFHAQRKLFVGCTLHNHAVLT